MRICVSAYFLKKSQPKAKLRMAVFRATLAHYAKKLIHFIVSLSQQWHK